MAENPATDTDALESTEPEDVDEDGLDVDEPEDGAEPEWTPPTREQWEASQAKLKRAREQARKLREDSRAKPPGAPDADAAAASAAEVEKWQLRAVSTAAKAELLTRGADPDMVDLALGRLKAASVEFDDDGQPDLEEWLDEIQDRYPKLFKAPEPAQQPARVKAGRVEQGAAAGAPVRPTMSLGQRIIANSQGEGRRRR